MSTCYLKILTYNTQTLRKLKYSFKDKKRIFTSVYLIIKLVYVRKQNKNEKHALNKIK